MGILMGPFNQECCPRRPVSALSLLLLPEEYLLEKSYYKDVYLIKQCN